MSVCETGIRSRSPFIPTRRGPRVPGLRMGIWARPLRAPIEDGFAVDTGCDYDLVLAQPLRDRLRAAGVPVSGASMSWGARLPAERYVVRVLVGGLWKKAEAFFPVWPRVDENLVGLPLLRFEAICIRPRACETWVGRALG